MRILVFAALAAVLSGDLAASAQTAEDAGRFTIAPNGDGYLRLDTQSGAVSHCHKTQAGEWTCAPFREAESGRDSEIAALERRIDALVAQVAALRADLDRLRRERSAPPSPPAEAQRDAPSFVPPDEEEIERALGFMETMMRRLFSMVEEMKREAPAAP